MKYWSYSDSRAVYIQMIAVINLNIPLSSFFVIYCTMQ